MSVSSKDKERKAVGNPPLQLLFCTERYCMDFQYETVGNEPLIALNDRSRYQTFGQIDDAYNDAGNDPVREFVFKSSDLQPRQKIVPQVLFHQMEIQLRSATPCQ